MTIITCVAKDWIPVRRKEYNNRQNFFSGYEYETIPVRCALHTTENRRFPVEKQLKQTGKSVSGYKAGGEERDSRK